jgi:hypothetical protein
MALNGDKQGVRRDVHRKRRSGNYMRSVNRSSYTPLKPLIATIQRGLRWVGIDVRREIELQVHLAKDEESGIWYIAQSDIPGLRLEAESSQALIQKVQDVAPEMIELNVREILSAKAPKPKAWDEKPALKIRPVFDSPLAVACA